MVTVPLVADLSVNGQKRRRRRRTPQRLFRRRRPDLRTSKIILRPIPYYASPSAFARILQCERDRNGLISYFRDGRRLPYNGCSGTGTDDPNDPGFSNYFDTQCPTSVANASNTTPGYSNAPRYQFGWDLYSGSEGPEQKMPNFSSL